MAQRKLLKTTNEFNCIVLEIEKNQTDFLLYRKYIVEHVRVTYNEIFSLIVNILCQFPGQTKA